MTPGDGPVVQPELLEEDREPAGLVGREEELGAAVATLLSGHPRNGHVWFHGPPGAGRSALARHAAKQVPDAIVAHIDCRTARTAFLALDRLIERLALRRWDMRRELRVLLETLRAGVRNRRLIVVLDDVDALPAREFHDLLVALTSIETASLLATAKDTRRLVGELRQPHPCVFLPRVIDVEPLSPRHIAALVLARAQAALAPGACLPGVADSIAEAADRDARVAVQILRRVANLAAQRKETLLQVGHVRAVADDLRAARRAAALGRLTPHHHRLLAAIEATPGATADEVRTRYAAECRAAGTPSAAERTLRKYLNRDLRDLGLIRVERTGARGNVLRYWPLAGARGTDAPPGPQA